MTNQKQRSKDNHYRVQKEYNDNFKEKLKCTHFISLFFLNSSINIRLFLMDCMYLI